MAAPPPSAAGGAWGGMGAGGQSEAGVGDGGRSEPMKDGGVVPLLVPLLPLSRLFPSPRPGWTSRAGAAVG